MIWAILIGAVIGFVGFLPLMWGIRRVRGVVANGNGGLLGLFLLCIFISLIVLLASLIICGKLFRPVVVPFAAAEIGVFIIATLVYGFTKARQK